MRHMRKTDALSFYGNQQRMAEALGRAPSTISEYPEILPLETALLVELLSKRRRKVDWSLYPKAPPMLREGRG